MSAVDKARAFNYFAQASFINASGTVEKFQQQAFELPVDLAQRLGYSPKKAEMIRGAHRRVLGNLHSGVRNAVDQLGNLFVDQVGEVQTLVNDLVAMSWSERSAKTQAGATNPPPAPKAAIDSTAAGTNGDKPARAPAAAKKTGKKKGAT